MRNLLILFAVSAFLFSACNGYQPAREIASDDDSAAPKVDSSDRSGSDSVISSIAQVDEVQVQQMESFPVQIRVLVKGNLPDGCTQIDTAARVRREENVFMVMLYTRRPKDAMCTQALVPYEKIIPLDVAGLEAGEFTVNVNGEVQTFKLLTKNQLDKRE